MQLSSVTRFLDCCLHCFVKDTSSFKVILGHNLRPSPYITSCLHPRCSAMAGQPRYGPSLSGEALRAMLSDVGPVLPEQPQPRVPQYQSLYTPVRSHAVRCATVR